MMEVDTHCESGSLHKKRGLAIIITNDYTTKPVDSGRQRNELKGTTKDGKRLKEAFEALDFEVQWRKNISKEELGQTILELKGKSFDAVKHYKCIVLVFSGHGEKDGKLIMQDGHEVDACAEFIDPLLPGEARIMGDIPKVFIIDACRGDDETETTKVPKLVTDKGSRCEDSSVDPVSQDKGGYEIKLKDLPKKSNFLVAYSTLPGCISSEYHAKGSLWLEILARRIPTPDVSIEDLLTDVNEELMEECQRKDSHYKFQQPEKIGRLNSRLYLRESNPAVSQEVPMDTAPVPEQYKSLNPPAQTCLQNQQLANQKVVQGMTSSPSQAARAQPMYTPIAASTHGGDNLNQKTQTKPLPTTRGQGSQTYYRDLLKEFISPKYDYISEEMSSGVKRYRCNISFRHKGKLKYANSGGYLTTKHGAAERAAKRALKQEGWLPES